MTKTGVETNKDFWELIELFLTNKGFLENAEIVCNLSEDPLTIEPRPPVLMADTSISNNTSTPSNTEEPRKEMANHDNYLSNLDEELLSILINLQNAEPNTQHEIGNQW